MHLSLARSVVVTCTWCWNVSERCVPRGFYSFVCDNSYTQPRPCTFYESDDHSTPRVRREIFELFTRPYARAMIKWDSLCNAADGRSEKHADNPFTFLADDFTRNAPFSFLFFSFRWPKNVGESSNLTRSFLAGRIRDYE